MLGKKVKDKISGFEGIAIGNQIGICPTVDKDGKRQDVQWFDEGRIEVIGEGFLPESVQADKNGCEYNDHP
jgi:hypothetical protein